MSEFDGLRLADGSGLRLVGELDVATASELTAALQEEPWDASPLALDLSELTFVDSCGIHAILSFARSLNGSGPLVLSNPTEAVARVFEILDLDAHDGIEIRRDTAGRPSRLSRETDPAIRRVDEYRSKQDDRPRGPTAARRN